MTMKMSGNRIALLGVALAGALVSLPQITVAAASGTGARPFAGDDSSVASEVQSKLNKPQFKNVKVDVQGGVATLSGTVDLYEYKLDADTHVHKVKGVNAVRNDIEVTGPIVSDRELQAKLQEKLVYDRVGYGNVFNAITLSAQNGDVTLGGHARTDVDKDSALALVSTYPGVKEVENEVQVDPVSSVDDQTEDRKIR